MCSENGSSTFISILLLFYSKFYIIIHLSCINSNIKCLFNLIELYLFWIYSKLTYDLLDIFIYVYIHFENVFTVHILNYLSYEKEALQWWNYITKLLTWIKYFWNTFFIAIVFTDFINVIRPIHAYLSFAYYFININLIMSFALNEFTSCLLNFILPWRLFINCLMKFINDGGIPILKIQVSFSFLPK